MNKMSTQKNLTLTFFFKLLFMAILYELVIGGGGHFFELGPLTLRMLLYGIGIIFAFVYYGHTKGIKKNIAVLTLGFTLTSILACIVGIANNAPVALLIEDLKPLSFFYTLLFFSIIIKDVNDVERVIVVMKRGSLTLGIIFVTVVLMLLTGRLNFIEFYSKQTQIGEIIFRNNTLFVYKGFIYLCIGFFFFLFSKKGKYNKLAALFLLVCIVMTLTRGFMLFTFLIAVYYILVINKNTTFKVITVAFCVIAFMVLIPMLLNSLGNKSDSDEMRYLQTEQVIDMINPVSFLIGHGFGVGVPIRPVHLELSFFEIFHKQGLLGLAFWIGMIIHIFIMYFNIKDKYYKSLAIPFFFSVIFVVLQSGTNPYMNNPIGMAMMLITIVVFTRLLEFEKKKNEYISLHSHV